MELFIGLVGLVAALLILITTMIIILMLHEQKKESALVKADNKKAFRQLVKQVVKQELKPLEAEVDDLLLAVRVLNKGTSALAKSSTALAKGTSALVKHNIE